MSRTKIDPIIIPRVFKHSGANYAMQNRLRKCMDEGMTVEETCIELNIDPNCVASFFDMWGGKTEEEPAKKEDWEEAPKPAPKKRASRAKAEDG